MKNKNDSKIIAISFDNCIVENCKSKKLKPRKDSLQYLSKLHNEGNFLIIWTHRSGDSLLEAINWLETNKVKYNKINENPPLERAYCKPFPKIYYDYVIDSRSFQKLPCWSEIYRMIHERILEDESTQSN